ncbi:hypothetical protein Trydic_g777 [Trypoxylus dichotomus]
MSLVSLASALRYNIRYSYAAFTSCRHNSTQDTADQQQTNEKYEADIKSKILEASLGFVSSKGWSKDAIAAGAQEIGYPGITHGMFARGGGDLVHYFQYTSNQKLVKYMKEKIENVAKHNSPGEFVEDAVKHRLKMIIPFLSRWPQAIAIMALPPNVQNALASQLTMVDDICYYAGDRSVDFSWYARRLALAAIYKATELYMIQDKSADFVESWNFLNNRLTEAIQLQNLLLPTDGDKRSADALSSAFITARNILGMNNR